ncbi:MAG: sialidase family protein [Acidimicrobiales bacterium]
MRTRLRLAAALLVVAGLVVLPGPPAGAQEQPSATDVAAFKEEMRTLVSAGDLEGADLAAVAAAAGGHAGRSGRDGPNVQVSQNQDPATILRSGASELALAADVRGRRLVAGWNDAEGFAFAPFVPGQPALGLSGYGFSSNGGRTWTDGGAPPAGTTVAFGPGTAGRSETGVYVTRGDPWLDENGRGEYFYANLGVWTDDAATPPAGVSVHRGSFGGRGGRDFSWNDSVLIQSPNYPNDFLDKEALAVDRIGNRTAVYVSVTNFEEVCDQPFFGFGTIELYRSLDSGATWSRTIIQPDETFVTDPADPACGQDGVPNQGSAPAVGPNGELYVAWERGRGAPDVGGSVLPRATIAFAASTDRGATFTAPSTVASICSGSLDEPAGYNRTSSNDFPRLAVAQSGRHRGRIYLTYQDCSATQGSGPFGFDTDVYVTFSDNRGRTWSQPRPVHRVSDGRQQLWPVVSVGEDGEVDVTYYEMSDVNVTPDPADVECSVRTGGTVTEPVFKESTLTTFSDTFAVRSTDGGRTWRRPVRLTDVRTNWCAATPINSIIPNFGDYNTSLTRDDEVLVTWADGRNGGLVDRVPTAWFHRR